MKKINNRRDGRNRRNNLEIIEGIESKGWFTGR
jgi:hypothetical protein